MNLGFYGRSEFTTDVPRRTKTTLARKTAIATRFFTETKIGSSMSFVTERNSINIIFWPLLQHHCQEKHKCQAQLWQRPTPWACGQLGVSEWMQIQEYFARMSMTRVPDQVYSPDLSSSAFQFFVSAKKQRKDRVITRQAHLKVN
jgi:hypothetical protein